VLTIVYALIGIPLTFLYLSNIGNFLADCFRLFYKRICCDVLCCEKCERKRKRQRLKQRRRREITAMAAQQRNFRFGDWNGEIATADMEARGNPEFVEVPEVADAVPVVQPMGRHQSSSSWTTVSTSSAAAGGDGSAGEEAAAAGSGALETDIVEKETSATSDDERTTTDDGLTIRETDIIDDDEDDEDPTSSPDQNQRLPVFRNANTAPCRERKSARLRRSRSDTKLDAAARRSAANDANRRVHIVSHNRGAAAGALDRDVMQRSASVKARATGYFVDLLLLSFLFTRAVNSRGSNAFISISLCVCKKTDICIAPHSRKLTAEALRLSHCKHTTPAFTRKLSPDGGTSIVKAAF